MKTPWQRRHALLLYIIPHEHRFSTPATEAPPTFSSSTAKTAQTKSFILSLGNHACVTQAAAEAGSGAHGPLSAEEEAEEPVQLALVGRPNVGE